MITNEIQRDRLHILLDEVFPIMLAKGEFVSLGGYAYPCGSPMCIAGEACVLPKFVDMGLGLWSVVTLTRLPVYKDDYAAEALEKFFGEGSYVRLFDSNENTHSDLQEVKNRYRWLGDYLEV